MRANRLDEDLLLEMSNVLGKRCKVEEINFSFYFFKCQGQHTNIAKICWNRDKCGPGFDGYMFLFGDYKYIESDNSVNKHNKKDELKAREFFKKI